VRSIEWLRGGVKAGTGGFAVTKYEVGGALTRVFYVVALFALHERASAGVAEDVVISRPVTARAFLAGVRGDPAEVGR